jgi:hypothetical protein
LPIEKLGVISMSLLSRLNGWRRLWFVIAIIALIYAIGWGVGEGSKEYLIDDYVVTGFDNPNCAAVIQMPALAKLDPKPRADDPCWNLYLYRSIVEGAARTKEDYIQEKKSKRNEAILEWVVAALFLWAVGIAALYGVGKIVGWVAQGFRSQ